MMTWTTLLARAIRRRACAYWVDCRYIEPYGRGVWAVIVHGPNRPRTRELARHPIRIVALFNAWKRARVLYPTSNPDE